MTPNPLFAINEYWRRLDRLRTAMRERGVDYFLAADPANMYYLTAYDGWSFYVPQCVIVGADDGQPPLWWGRGIDKNGARRTAWLEDAQLIAYGDEYVHNPPKHPAQHLAAILSDLSARRVGYESETFFWTPRTVDTLKQSLPSVDWVDCDGLVNWLRAVKSDAEIACMRRAGKICAAAHQAAHDTAAVGVPKHEIAAAVSRATILGADGVYGDYPAMVPMMPAGADASAPHLTWDDRPLAANEGIFFELAGCCRRYHCPLSRTIYLGEPPSLWRQAEAALLDGISAGMAAAKPGNTCGDIAAALYDTLDKHGFEKAGRCGYSIGIAYPPDWGERTMSFRREDCSILQTGMTFHFMPGLWMDDMGIEITESIVITDDGCETLADYPRKLFSKA